MLLVQAQAYRAAVRLQLDLPAAGQPVRPAATTSTRQSSHVIPALIRKCVEAQRGRRDEIEVWGDGIADARVPLRRGRRRGHRAGGRALRRQRAGQPRLGATRSRSATWSEIDRAAQRLHGPDRVGHDASRTDSRGASSTRLARSRCFGFRARDRLRRRAAPHRRVVSGSIDRRTTRDRGARLSPRHAQRTRSPASRTGTPSRHGPTRRRRWSRYYRRRLRRSTARLVPARPARARDRLRPGRPCWPRWSRRSASASTFRRQMVRRAAAPSSAADVRRADAHDLRGSTDRSTSSSCPTWSTTCGTCRRCSSSSRGLPTAHATHPELLQPAVGAAAGAGGRPGAGAAGAAAELAHRRRRARTCCSSAGFEVIRHGRRCCWPIGTPIVAPLLNRYLVKIWPFRCWR